MEYDYSRATAQISQSFQQFCWFNFGKHPLKTEPKTLAVGSALSDHLTAETNKCALPFNFRWTNVIILKLKGFFILIGKLINHVPSHH